MGGAAVALALLAFYLGLSQRGVISVVTASVLVTLILLVTFDLDRPERGLRDPEYPRRRSSACERRWPFRRPRTAPTSVPG